MPWWCIDDGDDVDGDDDDTYRSLSLERTYVLGNRHFWKNATSKYLDILRGELLKGRLNTGQAK